MSFFLIIPLIYDYFRVHFFGEDSYFLYSPVLVLITSGSHGECCASVIEVRTSEIAHHLAKPSRLLVITAEVP